MVAYSGSGDVNRIPAAPPPIRPLSPLASKPMWSVMIPIYNASAYLGETLRSVLEQDLGPAHMQIEVVDDASTDADVAALVADLGQGRVKYVRQPRNVGSLRNFETCLNRSRGQIVHLLHGDDRVSPGYYQAMTELFGRYPQAGAAFCWHEHIDESGKQIAVESQEATEDGILSNWPVRLARRQRIQYCSMAVKRQVYEEVGSFYGVTYGEDWEMWMRIAHRYPVAYTPRLLASYRLYSGSISGQMMVTAQNLRDLQWVIDTIQPYLPDAQRSMVKQQSLKNYAYYGIDTTARIWHHSRNKQAVRAQVSESIRMHRDLYMWVKITRLYGKIMLNWS